MLVESLVLLWFWLALSLIKIYQTKETRVVIGSKLVKEND